MITVLTKDVGEVRDKIIQSNVKISLEDCNEDYIKGEMGIDGL